MHEHRFKGPLTFFIVGGLGVAAVLKVLDMHPFPGDYDGKLSFAGMTPDTTPEVPTDTETLVDRRVDALGIPESLLGTKEDAYLTTADLERIRAILAAHPEWVSDVVAEYEAVMMTDGDISQDELAKLQAIKADLEATLSDLKSADSEFKKIADFLEQQRLAGADPERLAQLSRQMLEGTTLENVREKFDAVYTAAQKISLLDVGGKVWSGGLPKDLDEVWSIKFMDYDERNVPRRPAAALYSFFSANPKADFLVTEGFTGDEHRPTSYAIKERSAGHKLGYAFDVDFEHPETPKDVYEVLKNSNDPSYKVEYHVKTAAERIAMEKNLIKLAIADGMTPEQAQDFVRGRVINKPWVTGPHFHIVATGGIGPDINPDGPAPFARSASK